MSEEFWNYVTIYSVIYLAVDALIFGFACSIVERNKGYDDSGAWFIWGTLFGFIALIVVCAKPVNQAEKPKSYTGVPRIFYCPNCNATYGGFNVEKLVCPHCECPLVPTTFLRKDWNKLAKREKEAYRQQMYTGKYLLCDVGTPCTTVNEPINAANEIKQYKELLDMGAITQEEFESKKRQLLNL